MPHTSKTTSPARQEQRQQRPPQPRLVHSLHHRDADGTVHTLCGLRFIPTPAASKTPSTRCPACEAAAHLLEVDL